MSLYLYLNSLLTEDPLIGMLLKNTSTSLSLLKSAAMTVPTGDAMESF